MTPRTLINRAGVLAIAVVAVWVIFAPFSILGSANLALRYTMIAVSLVILTGWVGQISLAQAAFVGIGAFTTGLLVRAWGVPFPLTLPLAGLVSAGAAALLGVVALRVRGLFLAVATLIFAWMVQEYLFNQPWFAGVGGSSAAQIDPVGEEGLIPYFDFTNRRTFYFLMLAITITVLYAAANLRDSKTGRAWFAVKGSEVAAASLGIDVMRAKLAAFAVSGFIAGAAGSLVMTHEQVVTATAFSVQVSLFYLSVAVVGGLASLGGALGSGVLFASLQELFFRVEALSGFIPIVSTLLLVLVLAFFPAGLAGIPRRAVAFVQWVSRSTLVVHVRDRWERGSVDDGAPVADGTPRDDDAGARVPESSEEAVEAVLDDTPSASSFRAAVARFANLRGVWRRSEQRQALGAAPDALARSIERLEEEEEATSRTQEEARPTILYTPGVATKVALPARRRRGPVLAARNVTVRFGGLTAVADYTLEVREGEIVGLMGPNGAGKTTLFNAISGLNEPTSGTIELFGNDVTVLPVHERAQRGMGRTFQAIQLFGELSVFENLVVATHQRNPTGFFAHVAATRTAVIHETNARDRVRQVIALLGLEDIGERPVRDLPFGLLRLVELGRALVTGAPFVMLDEPASGLDNAETDRFIDLLLWCRQTLGITMLLIEHDVRMVTSLADYMYVIDRGEKIAEGTAKKVQRDPAVIAAYLGTTSASAEAAGRAGTTSDAQPRRSGAASGRTSKPSQRQRPQRASKVSGRKPSDTGTRRA